MLNSKRFPISKCKRLPLDNDRACFAPTVPTFFSRKLLFLCNQISKRKEVALNSLVVVYCYIYIIVFFLSRTLFILLLLRKNNCSQAIDTGKMYVARVLKVVKHGITFSVPSDLFTIISYYWFFLLRAQNVIMYEFFWITVMLKICEKFIWTLYL